MSLSPFKRGTQIVYVPSYVSFTDPSTVTNHPDCERGFVTSPAKQGAWCRFWRKDDPTELRTRANSELAYAANLIIMDSVPQKQVEQALEEFCSKNPPLIQAEYREEVQ